MRVIIQRVKEASVHVDSKIISKIKKGLLIFVGVTESDTDDDINWLVKKISNLRIFEDESGMMNKSLIDIDGEALVVSQFTLFASTKKGNRPSYIRAARPEVAIEWYNDFVEKLRKCLGKKIETGVFGADMKVSLINDGPVTISIDTQQKE